MSIWSTIGDLPRQAVGLLPFGGAIQEIVFDPGTRLIDKAIAKVTGKKGLDPEVRAGLDLLIDSWNEYYADETGARAALFEGKRSVEKEQEAIDTGHSALSDPNRSKHVQGLAGDIWFKDSSGWINPDDVPQDWYYALGELGEEIGFTWGGRWLSLVDMPHFEV